MKIKKGDVAHFKLSYVQHDEDDPLPVYSWKKEGKPIYESKKYAVTLIDNFIHLKIFNTEVDDTARYTVRLENQNGSTECSCQLIIQGLIG